MKYKTSILQITDIHINGEYDGQFDVRKHFSQILEVNKPGKFDAIVLTGDIVDNGTYEDYIGIFRQLMDTFGEDTPILVTPGNHDNRDTLEQAYLNYRTHIHKFKRRVTLEHIGGSFTVPGSAVDIVTISIKNPIVTLSTKYPILHQFKLVTMDTSHKSVPEYGLGAFLCREPSDSTGCSYSLFTHMPIIRSFHRFMNRDEHSISDKMANQFLNAMKDIPLSNIFCGDYHCASITSNGKTAQYVAPASQCQIDPFSSECVPSGNYPGYAVIDLFAPVAAEFHYITEDENGN